MNARIAYTPHDLFISCPVDDWRAVQAFVNELKRIPSRQRKWLELVKLWRVSLRYEDAVLGYLAYYFGGHEIVDLTELQAGSHDGGQVQHRRMLGDPYRVLYVQPDAPPEVISAAYRALAKKYHPDVAGAVETMQRINAAAEQILGAKRCV